MTLRSVFRHSLIWLPIVTLAGVVLLLFKPLPPFDSFHYTNTLSISKQNKALVASNERKVGPELIENSKHMLLRAPLDAEALMYSAYGQALTESNEMDQKLLNAAKQRNPRKRSVRKMILLDAQTRADIPAIVEETTVLYNLDRKNRTQYTALLLKAYDTYGGPKLINTYLTKDALWSYKFLNEKINILEFNQTQTLKNSLEIFLKKSKVDKKSRNRLITNYSKRLIHLSAYDEALVFWLENTEIGERPSPRELGLFNPTFEKLEANPPFNWDLSNDRDVSTEYNYSGGFFGGFRGKKPALIARQSLPWRVKEKINLSLEGTHKYNKNKGLFYIDIRCHGSNDLIARFEINNSLKENDIIQQDLIANPHQCNFAYVDIKARPGNFTAPIAITLNSLDIK